MPMHVNSSSDAPPQHLRPNMDAGGSGGVGLGGLHAYTWAPLGSPSISDSNNNDSGRRKVPQDGRQQQYSDDSATALSFGFLATAILVSMFLVMAVFERFLRPAAESPPDNDGGDVESQSELAGGKRHSLPSTKMSVYDSGVSVLMPGDDVPSFIAHPAPISHAPSRTSSLAFASSAAANNPTPASHYEPVLVRVHLEINVINSCYI